MPASTLLLRITTRCLKLSNHVLRILQDIHSSPLLAVIADEATEKSNKEQLTLVVRWISDVIVSEEFLGLYCLSTIDAQSIVDVMKDAILRFHIPLTKQCYGWSEGWCSSEDSGNGSCVHALLWACAQPWCQRHHQAVAGYEGLSRHLFRTGEADQIIPKARGHAA